MSLSVRFRIAFFSVTIFLLSFGSAFAKDSTTIQIKGSDTMVNLGQAWAEEFMNQHPEVSIAVTGGGSGPGGAAVIVRTRDM